MPTYSSFLNLTLYDINTDGSSLVLSFVDDMTGVRSSNASKIDLFLRESNGSAIILQDVLSEIVGIDVMSNTTGSAVIHNDSPVKNNSLYPGKYNTFKTDQFGHISSASFISLGSSPLRMITRQGGNANDWSTSGSSNYSTGSSIKSEVGVSTITWPGTVTDTTGTVTFSSPFSYKPIVFAQIQNAGDYHVMSIQVPTISASGFSLRVNTPAKAHDAPLSNAKTDVNWVAFGPI